MEEVKEVKFYAVMFDCTPDVSHLEERSHVLKYGKVVGNVPEITERWEVLLKYSPLALKKESETRWSSRREAVIVVHKHLDKIVETLNHLALDAVACPVTKSGAVLLLKSIQTFEFVAFTCFWQKIVQKIDIVSKLLQKEDTAIDVARNRLKGLTAQIKDYRGAIVNEVLEEAKQSCLALNVDPYFKKVRKRKKKGFFDEKCKDESSEISQHKKFKLALLQGNDRIKAELERRF
ncbi:hypothetical protein AVEN_37367-1 [Araneus ventricosus]|uniref:Uncharacterized protein n=1 Tax=Araneus ventricosus TaxID=182803 RepID=A0A4Y2TSR0_ARAVE|nr:hypothetical protein AVEN_37367-1 [Araneus ventricosus]